MTSYAVSIGIMPHPLFGLLEVWSKDHELYPCNAERVKNYTSSFRLVDDKIVSNLAEHCSGNN